VLLTVESQLTSSSTAAPNAPDLYEYSVVTGRLTDLTGAGEAGERANVLGVIGASEDGAYVYFVANGALASGAAAGSCQVTQPATTCNLYLRHEGVTTFIATLSGEDNELLAFAPNPLPGDWQPGLADRTAQVTPDGRHIVLMSRESLTHYPSHGVQEVYVYDAGTTTMLCASCDPSGAPPLAANFRTAAVVTPGRSDVSLPRWITDDGSRVFFNSEQALVPQATNGLMAVYEWEHNGAGSCRRAGGCIYLLSGGASKDGAVFAEASASGNDVFMVTRARLVPQDGLETFKMYDARVGAPRPPAATACSGTGCQGVPPAPPIFATPSSVTFNGAGNYPPTPPVKGKTAAQIRAEKLAKALSTCRKKYKKQKKKRAACEKTARKAYGSTAKKATTRRRAGR
jgi:hypothetical protein